ncbi:MAG TPA: type 1 glutamine amidotransferase family protein [Gemmatimonadales bacterium]|jgi:putative intracellular protease/amidase
MKPAPHLLVFDGFADWEPSYAVAELRRSGGHQLITIGYSGEPVVSMGGLCVLPDFDLAEVDFEHVRMLILPGGDRWEREPLDETLLGLLHKLMAARTPIAAICGATLGVVRAGLHQGRKHTSNGLAYLKEHVPDYTAEGDYVNALAVRDRGLITASGLGAVEFAREIFAELGVFSAEDREKWYGLFKRGE